MEVFLVQPDAGGRRTCEKRDKRSWLVTVISGCRQVFFFFFIVFDLVLFKFNFAPF